MGNSGSKDEPKSPNSRVGTSLGPSRTERIPGRNHNEDGEGSGSGGGVGGGDAAAAGGGGGGAAAAAAAGSAGGTTAGHPRRHNGSLLLSHAARLQPSNPTSSLVSIRSASTSTSQVYATSLSHHRQNHLVRSLAISSGSSITTAHTNTTATTAASSSSSFSSHHHVAARDLLSASDKSDSLAMGNHESKPNQRPPSRVLTLPTHSTTTPPSSRKNTATPDDRAASEPTPEPTDVPPALPLPVHHDSLSGKDNSLLAHPEPAFNQPAPNYSRPPRLPLPIEEEVLAPGSPILSPRDVQENSSLLEQADADAGHLPRHTSVLSSTTLDEDDIGDNDAFATEASQYEVRVPTKLEWNRPGEKVFATGTFCNWEKKVKLYPNEDKPGFSATVNLRPGTHHIKFLVDGEMVTSSDLPTTVDWINILVNYIEIVAPMPPTSQEEKQLPVPTGPMPIPGAAITAGQATAASELASRVSASRLVSQEPETLADLSVTVQDPGLTGGHVDALSEKQQNAATTATTNPTTAQPPQDLSSSQLKEGPRSTPGPPKQRLPRPKYTNHIPDFLIDLDSYNNPNGEERFQRAQRVATTLPAPPSLPMFLSKSILNGATPHKDDASVLLIPNHTVLNHLATSSIKSGVLATSGTTRYNRKFLTTIMYKPTSEDG